MVGQQSLHDRIEHLVFANKFPRFSIFVGAKGSGKKTFVRELFGNLPNALYCECGIKVDDVREVINDSYKIQSLSIYCIPDVDNMSYGASNALLKVIEEPPNNAYFILTVEDESSLLETVRSRAMIFHMNRYTPDEIEEYAAEYLDAVPGEAVPGTKWDIVRNLCETPGDVETLLKSNPSEFYDYVRLVVDNVAEVSLANSFKIADKVSLKEGENGYDLKLFWKIFLCICQERLFGERQTQYIEWMYLTSRSLNKLHIKGINRKMLFDSWILQLRRVEK